MTRLDLIFTILISGLTFFSCGNNHSHRVQASCEKELSRTDSISMSNAIEEIIEKFGCYSIGSTVINNSSFNFIFEILETNYGVKQPIKDEEVNIFNTVAESLRFTNENRAMCISGLQAHCNPSNKRMALFLSLPVKGYIYAEVRSSVWDYKPIGEVTNFLVEIDSNGSVINLFKSSVYYN